MEAFVKTEVGYTVALPPLSVTARLQANAARPELVEHVLSLVGSERHSTSRLHYGD